MLNHNPLDFIRDQLEQHTPSALRPLAHDVKQQAKRWLPQTAPAFGSQDFVSREQFNAQQALLEQALKRIAALEQQLAAAQSLT